VLDVGPERPTESEGGPACKFWDPLISREQMKLEALYFACI